MSGATIFPFPGARGSGATSPTGMNRTHDALYLPANPLRAGDNGDVPLPFPEMLPDVLDAWRLRGMAAGHSPRTIDARRGTIERLARTLDPMQATRDDLTAWMAALAALGLESIDGPHPVVPLLVRDTDRTRAIVRGLFDRHILAVGLTFPVVPQGDETIRFQVNAAHTAADIEQVLQALAELAR